MKVLVINCGSSSIKYKLFFLDTQQVGAEGIVERVGESNGEVNHVSLPGDHREKRVTIGAAVPDHGRGLEIVIGLLTHPDHGVISNRGEIAAIGHRVVHGGEFFRTPTLMEEDTLAKIEAMVPLAPLHNPANLKGITVARLLFPGTPQVAVFDTAFHQSLPACAYRYAVPDEYYTRHHLRRYGFHGTSHQYVARKAAAMLGLQPEKANLITLHLGSGCSVTAVRNGASADTSMGMTPVAGLIMGTRCGDIDPGIAVHMERTLGLAPVELDTLLNKNSGLKGICGFNDMRDIQRRRREGDARAQLAFEMFVYSVKKYIGAYAAVLGRLDALVFTAGIGENDPEVRAACCANLDLLGIRIDPSRNRERRQDARSIHSPAGSVAVLVIPTDEEYEIARQTADILAD
ncbi:MAG: acetate kinase [Deltaproteobacteria bacterium HGW-Deltaproteobacteria-21]|nr:MAG: acetate kinase [Deltaproteobacteria bacterium HGW-Deltaproteobacteria-21]